MVKRNMPGATTFTAVKKETVSTIPTSLRRFAVYAGFMFQSAVAATATPSDLTAQAAHASGTCGTMAAGTGLSGGRGWVVSMIPGRREFRVKGGGEVYLTVARTRKLDFDAGRPYYIVVEKAHPSATLEWRSPGQSWEPVATTFLYPVQR